MIKFKEQAQPESSPRYFDIVDVTTSTNYRVFLPAELAIPLERFVGGATVGGGPYRHRVGTDQAGSEIGGYADLRLAGASTGAVATTTAAERCACGPTRSTPVHLLPCPNPRERKPDE